MKSLVYQKINKNRKAKRITKRKRKEIRRAIRERGEKEKLSFKEITAFSFDIEEM